MVHRVSMQSSIRTSCITSRIVAKIAHKYSSVTLVLTCVWVYILLPYPPAPYPSANTIYHFMYYVYIGDMLCIGPYEPTMLPMLVTVPIDQKCTFSQKSVKVSASSLCERHLALSASSVRVSASSFSFS